MGRRYIETLRLSKLPIATLVCLYSLDSVSTWRALKQGFSEKNYFLLKLAGDNIVGITVISLFAFGLFLSLYCLWIRSRNLLWVFNVVYAIIIGGNLCALALYNAGKLLPY